MSFAADYIDVAERVREFRAKHPDGSLQPLNLEKPFSVTLVGDHTFLVYAAAAYRTPDDARPGIGVAWEPFPGKTNFTRDSELMNAETSAWGRAIVAALAADTKKIASLDEVQARAGGSDDGGSHAPARQSSPPARPSGGKVATEKQRGFMTKLIEKKGLPDGCPYPVPEDILMSEASKWIDVLQDMEDETPKPQRANDAAGIKEIAEAARNDPALHPEYDESPF